MRHSQEAIRKLVKEQQSSGKTVREFCAARGLNPIARKIDRFFVSLAERGSPASDEIEMILGEMRVEMSSF